MQHIEGCERDQSQLLPARVDDYVHGENPGRKAHPCENVR
jgi:hypothetical protein